MSGHRVKRGHHRAVSIQIRVRVRRPNNFKLTKAFLADAVRYRIENGEDLEGVEITGVVWENSDRTYEYEDPDKLTQVLEAAKKIFDFRPSVFHPVWEDKV